MSILPGEKLRYAETHFKFKLPWSLLYRPWPEIFTDAPFQFVPGKTPLLWIVVRDAHRFPVAVKSLEISIRRLDENSPDETRRFDHLELKADQPFHFFPVGIGALEPGLYEIFPKVVACRNGKCISKHLLSCTCESYTRISYINVACCCNLTIMIEFIKCATYINNVSCNY